MGNNAFILLAGGKSERMGIAKGLLKYRNTYWILEQLTRISKTTISKVYIGLGNDYELYFKAIPWLEKAKHNAQSFQNLQVKVTVNKKPELGSFSTLQTVLKSIKNDCDILINPIDIPILNSQELNIVIQTNNLVVQTNYKGKNGHPIKISSQCWNSFLNLDLMDDNSRLDFQIKKIDNSMISKISVKDKSVIENLNTPKDWRNFLSEN